MNDFFPFIHDPKKKTEYEPEPLYIELIEPMPDQSPKIEENDNNIVIIQL